MLLESQQQSMHLNLPISLKQLDKDLYSKKNGRNDKKNGRDDKKNCI